MSSYIPICASGDVPEGGRLTVDIGQRTIGVFRVKSKVYAYENRCPHQGGPVCQGAIIPRVVERITEARESAGFEFHTDDLHIVCPWHGFEFNIETGCHPGRPEVRLLSVAVQEAEGQICAAI